MLEELSARFLTALADDFEKNGLDALYRLRSGSPKAFLEIVSMLRERGIDLTVGREDAFNNSQLAAAVGVLAAKLRARAAAITSNAH